MPVDSSIIQFYTAKSKLDMQSPPNNAGRNQKPKQNQIFTHSSMPCLKNNVQGPKPGTQEPAQQVSTPWTEVTVNYERSWNLVSVTNLTGACDEGTEPSGPPSTILPGIWTPYRTRVIWLYLPKCYFPCTAPSSQTAFIVKQHKKSLSRHKEKGDCDLLFYLLSLCQFPFKYHNQYMMFLRVAEGSKFMQS